MKLKALVDEDFVQFKKPSMTLLVPYCDWKCGQELCQNTPLAKAPTLTIDNDAIVERYMNNPITEAIVFSGLEPFIAYEDVYRMIEAFRARTNDWIIIYTGYDENEVFPIIHQLSEEFVNIIVKYGRYKPGQVPHLDKVLGIELASDNQYAEIIS